MKFVDVKNDVAFHKIFGNAGENITLISFLNAVLQLEGTARVASVTIENPYLFPPNVGGKTSIIDIRATDQAGNKFIVEMHASTLLSTRVADKEGFVKRSQYYAARDYSMQINRGEEYPQLRPTHFIGILNFETTQGDSYFSHHITIDTRTGEHLLKDVQYFFIELPKFRKAMHELDSMIDKWTFFIKNAENLNVIPENVQDEGLQTAYIEADKHSWTKEELNAYDDASVRVADWVQERLFAERKGLEKGLAEGLEKGREEGKEKAMEEAILGMHAHEIPVALIAKSLKVTEEKVQEVIEKALT